LFVAGGVGVARLLGEPAARWYAPQSIAPREAQTADSAALPVIGPSTQSQTAGARLVPDFAASNPYGTQSDPSLAHLPPPLLPVPGSDDDLRYAKDTLANSNSFNPAIYEPRATLRDEAPRPLEMDQRLTVPLESAPAASSASVATIVSFDEPAGDDRSTATIGPPPWLLQDERGSIESDIARTHIVVDGDSLERLAERYLDDPQRASEIYGANRELLTSPDLLPIGVELTIPSRNSVPTFDSTSPQSFIPRSVAVRLPATDSGLVPVRPIPSSLGMMPRAQLARPLPVE
jgi:nucleoid-associated protein YgaU